jgi:hypothetical protein
MFDPGASVRTLTPTPTCMPAPAPFPTHARTHVGPRLDLRSLLFPASATRAPPLPHACTRAQQLQAGGCGKWVQLQHSKYQIYFCNIQIKLLQHTSEIDETFMTYSCNTIATCATSRSIFETFKCNTWNIQKKTDETLETYVWNTYNTRVQKTDETLGIDTLATYVYNHCNICNIHVKQLKRTSETTET